MMISPEAYANMQKNKSYEELIKERDSLIEDIQSFEKDKDRSGDAWMVEPSPEVIYQCNFQYLGKLSELIAEVYNRVYVWGEEGEISNGK